MRPMKTSIPKDVRLFGNTMSNFRPLIKHLFYKINVANALDYMLFKISQFRNRKKNNAFRKAHQGLVIPPDYFLYETYRLDYAQFYLDGEQTAREIVEWTKDYLPAGSIRILDWGCGVGRNIIHFKKFVSADALLYGCDVNRKMIEFDSANFKDISFDVVPFSPPTLYQDNYFSLVYGISIFTHIKAFVQEEWIKEMHRILKAQGIFLFTTHGSFFDSKLLKSEKDILLEKGSFTKDFKNEGHRMMSTYNSALSFRKLLQPYFEVLEFYDGSIDSSRTGGQDLWIVRKT